MWPLLILGAAGLLLATQNASKSSGSPTVGDGGAIVRANAYNLPDIDSSQQKGVYIRDYDESFEKAAAQTGVPFALIKAHAIRESSLNPRAYHYDNPSSGASYGLLQVEWNNNDRFDKYGFPDSIIGSDGSGLYDADTSAYIGACIIRDNLGWLDKNKTLQGLRDTINSYNTGTTEAKHPAPANYVDDVLGYYSELIGQPVTV